ncbi:hydroxyethylthiazole kinase [Alicyclobacillus cycloheptanicus]|uniref:Hydroxyethylthiazole kinase n=1 Tax=Alicyclobacillus cycloheptanicus TaxID=1457 RepID=A0ABT9XKM5_9BACL|nr:hydroxyethylthiazole kinase [Alicyclobacillus cycloheptanicus]MDQ0190685.1 hydroxyethylthiazole kinase [Alicyclobacillus cycloheptanicus]WDM00300.1 hydroxyethylthiazole kinase [Alicyclobacillus cycloheptanicus]
MEENCHPAPAPDAPASGLRATHAEAADEHTPGAWLTRVRAERPLVHNITNLVVTNVAANALLAIGASPVMAYAHEEVADMARIARAVALNMGTLTPDVITAMRIAGKAANEAGVPVVFDPVGAGATPYRSQAAAQLTEALRLTVLRGNTGEIGVLLGAGGQVTGVDSSGAGNELPQAMKAYARARGTVVIATGAHDLVTDGESLWQLHNGHPLLGSITGSGCSLTAILGAFVGSVAHGSPLSTYASACVAAVTCFNVAGELAAASAQGPGTFQAALFDALYHLTEADVNDRARVERVSL